MTRSPALSHARPSAPARVVLLVTALVLMLGGSLGAAGVASAAPPELTVVLPSTAEHGRAATLQARVEGGPGQSFPAGEAGFEVYAADDPTCAGPPLLDETAPVNPYGFGSQGAISDATAQFTPPSIGSFPVVVTYAGDETHEAAGPTACDANVLTATKASAGVSGFFPRNQLFRGESVTPFASVNAPPAKPGGSIGTPTGTTTISLYGPVAGDHIYGDGSECDGTPLSVETVPLVARTPEEHGNGMVGQYAVAEGTVLTPTELGVYFISASYSGDDTYLAQAGACNQAGMVVRDAPNAAVDPGSLTFGSGAAPQPVGTMSRTQYVTLTNSGAGAPSDTGRPTGLDVGSIAVSDTDEWVISSNTCPGRHEYYNPAMIANESCTVGVRFTPMEPGVRTGTLSFATNDPDSPSTVVTLTGHAGAVSSGGSGTDGTNGQDGTNGLDGADGTNGLDGANGKDGTNGTNGTNGITGKDGVAGAPGLPGAIGPVGSSSALAPPFGAYSRDIGLLCAKRLKTCRITALLGSGSRFVSATLIGRTAVAHTARSRSKAGVLLNAKGRALRLSPGKYELRLRTARGVGKPFTRVFTVYVSL